MGINGLWPLVEGIGTNITLDALEGKRVAIDVSFWIYQAQNGQNNVKATSKSPFVTLLINRIAKLLYYKVRPVFVFDGEEIPIFKKQILRNRLISRQLEEMTWSKAQKRIFEQLAHDHLKGDNKNRSVNNGLSKGYLAEYSARSMPSSSKNCDRISVSLSGESSNSEYEMELEEACESIDDKIALIESAKEQQKNSRLQPEEIPSNSEQFSKFQLGRLIERNELSAKLEKLKKDKIWKNIYQPLEEGHEKIIVADKQKRVHVLTRINELQLCEDKNESMENFDWLNFVKSKIKCDLQKKPNDSRNASSSSTDSHSTEDNDDEFINVSDCDIGNGNTTIDDKSELTNNLTSQQFLDYIENEDEELEDEMERHSDKDHFETRKLQNFERRNNEEDIYADCFVMLSLLGIPFIKAPAEAEAQCVELERLGLVDGIVTDDSDVWLFGGRKIYRHMFSRKKHLQKYCAEEISRKLGLRRAEFIQLGMLAGGDYSRGLEKVGIVTALELVSEFFSQNASFEDEFERALSSLKCISNWLLSERNGRTTAESNRRQRLRKAIKTNNDRETIESFPNVEVFDMYVKPRVDNLDKAFHWSRIDFEKLEKFLQQKFGLTSESLNKLSFGAFEKWNKFIEQKQRYQMKITEFARPNDIFGGILGPNTISRQRERVQQAIGTIKNATDAIGTDDIKSRRKAKKRTKKMPTKNKKIPRFAKKLNLSEESSDD